MTPALRSLIRSLLFAVLPVLLAYIGDAVWLRQLIPALTPELAAIIAAVVGSLARAWLPNVGGKRA